MIAMSEKDWQSRVLDFARLHGWDLRYHTHDSQRSQPGFPDLVLGRVATGELIFAELKTDVGKLSAPQTLMLAQLAACGAVTHVWRPRDWETVQDVLRRKR